MAEEKTTNTFYSENIDRVIGKLKSAVDKNLEVIDKDIDEDLSEDKYLNVLKARRMAAEDVIYMMKKIDELEYEKNNPKKDGETEKESVDANSEPVDLSKKFARK